MGGGSKKHDASIASNEHVQATEEAKHAEHVVDGKAIATIESDAATAVKENVNTEVATATEAVANEHAASATEATGAQAEVATISGQAATKDLLSPSSADATAQKDQQALFMQGLGDKSTDDLLLMAREAYWNNGLDEAAAIYQQLIQREPNVVAHKGELGNVYWRQGFPEKSASLYAEIALPMIKDGHADRVANMVGFIELFHPDKAAEIKKTLQGLK
jgi:hypothetical protein